MKKDEMLRAFVTYGRGVKFIQNCCRKTWQETSWET